MLSITNSKSFFMRSTFLKTIYAISSTQAINYEQVLDCYITAQSCRVVALMMMHGQATLPRQKLMRRGEKKGIETDIVLVVLYFSAVSLNKPAS